MEAYGNLALTGGERDDTTGLRCAHRRGNLVLGEYPLDRDDVGMVLHLGRRAHRQHAAVIQRNDAIGDPVDQCHVVLDHQHGDAELALHVADPERHVVGLLDIEA